MNRKPIYLAAVFILVLAVSVSAFAFLNSDNKNLQQTQQSNATPSPSAIAPVSTEPPQNKSTTQEQAIALAMPYINQYAADNNRTVANVTVERAASYEDTHKPCWCVVASFNRINLDPPTEQNWIVGYDVVVMVYTGDIVLKQPAGIM
jgi:hypothetical protein